MSSHPETHLATPADSSVASAHLNWNSDQPLRSEAYSLEHLEQHARQLAHDHEISVPPHEGRRLDRRLRENAARLATTQQAIAEAVQQGETITPDAEWLLDNYYIVEDQFREIHEDLPPSFYLELPKLKRGPWSGLPRVYILALELIAHTDSELDDETIARFIAAYQSIAPLTLGELWAIPIMLRFGLVENLRRLADQALATRAYRKPVQQMLAHWRSEGELRLGEYVLADHPGLVIELVECSREGGVEFDACLTQLEQRLAKHDLTIDELVRREQQRQASNQVSIGNVITSMRLIAAFDWNTFVERVSLVDEVLRRDPSGHYAQMTFKTRDRYRHVIEDLARRASTPELTVAEEALALAQDAADAASEDVGLSHVGFYLIDAGLATLERRLSAAPYWSQRARRAVMRHPGLVYFGGLAIWITLTLALLIAYAASQGASPLVCVAVALLALLPASELAVGLVNYLVTSLLPPHRLPKLEFDDRLPDDCQTVIVIPALLTGVKEADALVERLEMHYLANPHLGFSYALLTDLPDASAQHTPQDQPLLEHLASRFSQIAERYVTNGESPRFYWLHRERRWNAAEGCWMGWERKRGKLLEFNRLVRGDRETSYLPLSADL